MMLKLVILVITACAVSATTDSDWAVYKARYGKNYEGKEDTTRRRIWEENLQKVEEHNSLYAKGKSSYWLGENEYADMTTSEYIQTMTSDMEGHNMYSNKDKFVQKGFPQNTSTIPSEVNWVTKGYVTPVKNQGRCSSGWAFAATGGLEGAHFNKTGKLVSMSESNFIDCSSYTGNRGCKGGWAYKAFYYCHDSGGVDTEASYPYVPKEGRCKFNRSNIATGITGMILIGPLEEYLQYFASFVGPISVRIDARHASFQLYSGGVYDEPKCSSTQINHGMLLVGYGVYKGKEYYLVKNSFGKSWGLKGYIMMSRNKHNQCGIASRANFPLV